MAILKVEPLTTARALRGPFDYRRPDSMAGLEVGSLVRVPFGPRKMLGVVVELAESSELAPERLAEPIEALEAGASAERVALGLWVAREYCSTPSRGLSLVLPPGTGTGRAARTVRAKTELRAEITPAGEAALEGGERLGVKQRAGLEALVGSGERSAPPLAGAGRAAPPPRLGRGAAAPPRAAGRGRRPGGGARRRGRRSPRAASPRGHRLGQD